MVPIRSISDELKVDISWDSAARTIKAVKDDTTVILTIGEKQAVVNDSTITLAEAPAIINDYTYVPLRFFSQVFGMVVNWDGIQGSVTIEDSSKLLPAVASYDNLKELLAKVEDNGGPRIYMLDAEKSQAPVPAPEANTGAAAPSASKSAEGSGSSDYSKTNVQVEGVDEGDVVKTDGTYIYQVNQERIVIAQAVPAGDMKIVSTLAMSDKQMSPQEIYVDDQHLVVIGNSSFPLPQIEKENAADTSPSEPVLEKKMIMRPMNYSTKAVVYDISSKKDIKSVKEINLDGSYLTSRKIGSQLYLLTNKHYYWYRGMLDDQVKSSDNLEQYIPCYQDSALPGEAKPIDLKDIRYFPNHIQSSYLITAAIDLSHPKKKADVSALLGAGENVYASSENLYVALHQYPDIMPMVKAETDGTEEATDPNEENQDDTEKTTLFKFNLDQGKIRFAGKGAVPGNLLNQFSMDETNGYFRVATTAGKVINDQYVTTNNVYVLNEAMKITGKIEDIAPGEQIYSVRFMGNRGYMVTFKTVDPLFVLDLSNPENPSILGKLKIPGYSNYLHPYDETHLIGFGKDTIELSNSWAPGGTMAYYQGMKVALFDVSDVNNPIELFNEKIGDRGTDSELLYNHKALLFSREKNLLAFPVTVAKVNFSNSEDSGVPAYGEFTFQGAYVYNLDLEHGFRLKGKITHLNQEEMDKAGYYWYDSLSNINRILYIDQTLYTLSQSQIRASDMNTVKEINHLDIPKP